MGRAAACHMQALNATISNSSQARGEGEGERGGARNVEQSGCGCHGISFAATTPHLPTSPSFPLCALPVCGPSTLLMCLYFLASPPPALHSGLPCAIVGCERPSRGAGPACVASGRTRCNARSAHGHARPPRRRRRCRHSHLGRRAAGCGRRVGRRAGSECHSHRSRREGLGARAAGRHSGLVDDIDGECTQQTDATWTSPSGAQMSAPIRITHLTELQSMGGARARGPVEGHKITRVKGAHPCLTHARLRSRRGAFT